MGIPCNIVDFARFTKLAEALSKLTPPTELHIYASEDTKSGKTYVSIEMKGNLPTSTVRDAFGVE